MIPPSLESLSLPILLLNLETIIMYDKILVLSDMYLQVWGVTIIKLITSTHSKSHGLQRLKIVKKNLQMTWIRLKPKRNFKI